ncbi:L-serine ammonia-lyase [Candidatus Avelusimicrobium fimicolum]|uniref:L-serine ammonia-lyase n=1 Tax=Candidatus Avelusimicrobium fimicolum TaxID=3416216 RepID=UPI002A86F734|nr:L-serine ammonia-lyase [Elusimicrobiaceae bacterium]
MQSLKELYKIGMGPSSSHTMGPRKAADAFNRTYPTAESFRAVLYGSLAATGKGHLTDFAIKEAFYPKPVTIEWEYDTFLPKHPNAMRFEALDKAGHIMGAQVAYSIGGGDIRTDEAFGREINHIYPHKSMAEILQYTSDKRMLLWEYVEEFEGTDIWQYLATIWKTMQTTMNRGLEKRGVLPGSLNLERKARRYLYKAENSPQYLRRMNNLFSYALACSEENAAGGVVVTAPTCGSCGVVPAVCRLIQEIYEFEDTTILHALATASLFGNMAKTNASISGAEVGCQGEVGVACAMAAAAVCQLEGGDNRRIAYAAEMGLEHHLGLTCDPVDGLVQIPCIERNALAASRALDCATYALMSDGDNRVSYDDVLATMMQTGLDMNKDYRETARGGLARFFKEKVLRLKKGGNK